MPGYVMAQNAGNAHPKNTTGIAPKKTQKAQDEYNVFYEYANGDVYKGAIRDGKFEGYGVYQWADGNLYQGFFHEGLQEKEGSAFYVDKRNEW